MLLFIAFVCIGLLWWKIIRILDLQREFEERLLAGAARWNVLERDVAELRRPAPDTRRQTPVAEPEPEPEPEPAAAVVTETVEEVRTPVVPPPLPIQIPVAVPPPLPAMAPEPVRAESMLDQQVRKSGGWEELIGGNLLNKLGALVLVIGIALFLSYSFARMGPAGRAFTGLGVSVAILGGGIWLERKPRYSVFSRGVMAAGWGSLYFTAYAMHAMPAARIIENPTLGALAMLVVAVGMVAHSLKYRVETLTSLSYGTVFAALALSTQNSFVAVALIPLAGSMLFLARRFGWYGMAVFGAAATYVTFLTRPSEGSPLWMVQSLLLLYWTMFEAFDLLRLKAGSEDTIWTRGLFWVNALAGLGASGALWYRMAPGDMWQFCAAGAALYLTSMWIRFLLNENSRYEFALLLAAFLAGLGIFAGVPGIWDSMGLLLEAEVLFLAGLYVRLRLARVLSWLGFAAAWWQMVTRFGTEPIALLGAPVDVWAPPLGVMAAVFYANRYLSRQQVFGFLASAFVWIILGYELPWKFAGAAWVLFGAILFELGARRDLVEFRLQGYAVGLSGTLGLAMHPLRTHPAWALAGGTLVALGNAIRGSRWLTVLPELERGYVRISGSVGAALLGGLLMTRVAPEPYWGLAMLVYAVALLELAFRSLPVEMTVPAGALSVVALARVALDPGVEKFPEQSVWISFASTALICYYLTRRLPIAPWVGSAFAIASLWMLLPDAYLPAAIAALGLISVEANFLWLGRVVVGVAVLSLFRLDLGSARAETANSLALAAAQWWLWYRTRTDEVASRHGWVAAGIVAVLIPWQAETNMLALWSLFGSALAVGGRVLALRDLRWQAAALAAVAAGWSIGANDPLGQDAAVVGFLGLALGLEGGGPLRRGYSVAAALVAAVMLREQVSGGMLTLSWSLEGIVLLAAGFAARERILRLCGLTLLLLCIGKVFFFDLRNLETMYRILSFIGLGVVLLLVSWIYTRFREQLQRYL